ncbi:AAA family ATPase [Schaalia dentiphila]|jgi:hypothetical protein|uniref:AAA family ATPase n=1 Tax=Schaalia dentiphila TaxID=3050224 RepID=UPI0003010D6E|nr:MULTISPECIES: AAA family ATPase [Schaalia]
MKLVHASIQRYRSIGEPTEFDVEPDVTALVGKNESGKTAVLQSLYKSNPVDRAKFDPDLDFPTHRTREIAKGATVKVTDLTYELDGDDIAAIEASLCPGVLDDKRVVVAAGFRFNRTNWSISVNREKVLNSLRDSLDLPAADKTKVEGASTIDGLVEILQRLESDTPTATATLEKIKAWRDSDPVLAAIDILSKRRPKFVYFGDYDVMPGKVSIPRLISHRDSGALERGEEALLALLSMAEVELEDFSSPDSHEHLIRQMENAWNTISDEVFDYWSQNKELQVRLQVIATAEAGAEAPLDQAPLLQVRVENRRHRVTVPFDERSRGFVWFFSFLAYFSKLEEESTQPLILLLDEPGLSLHATAQHDLLRFINERLAARHQVIFTTHSPFMIDPHNFGCVRTVIDAPETGTTVSSDILKTDAESAFPLHAALGVELTQTLFVGPNVLLVEGPSDVIYLQYLSEQLIKAGKTGLDDRWVLVPGGGISKLAAFLTLFGANQMKVCVLADSSAQNNKTIGRLKASGKLYDAGIVQIGNASGTEEADIEDLLPAQLYVDLVNEAYRGELAGTSLTLDELPDGPRIVKRVEDAFVSRSLNNGRFNHYSPAGALLRMKETTEMSEEQLSASEVLIQQINALLD